MGKRDCVSHQTLKSRDHVPTVDLRVRSYVCVGVCPRGDSARANNRDFGDLFEALACEQNEVSIKIQSQSSFNR